MSEKNTDKNLKETDENKLSDTMKILKNDIEKAMNTENSTVVSSIDLEETQVIDTQQVAKLANKNTAAKEQKIKRDQSKQFLKVYMFALISVVVILIALSFSSQSKLTQQIQYLTDIVDSNDEQTITAMMSVEKLQILNEEQSKIINDQKNTIKNLENLDQKTELLDSFWKLQKQYYRENYTECLYNIVTIEYSLSDYMENDVATEYNAIKMSVLAHTETTQEQLEQMVKAIESEEALEDTEQTNDQKTETE